MFHTSDTESGVSSPRCKCQDHLATQICASFPSPHPITSFVKTLSRFAPLTDAYPRLRSRPQSQRLPRKSLRPRARQATCTDGSWRPLRHQHKRRQLRLLRHLLVHVQKMVHHPQAPQLRLAQTLGRRRIPRRLLALWRRRQRPRHRHRERPHFRRRHLLRRLRLYAPWREQASRPRWPPDLHGNNPHGRY